MTNLKDYVNWKLTHADKTAEAEGYPLVMENCKANKRMKQLELYGNSIQDGTPTPDNPIEVQSVGERTINLFDKDTAIKQLAYINVSQSRYYYSADSSSIAIPCNPNTTYTISHGIQTSIFRACYIKSDILPAPTGSQVLDAYECIQSSGDNVLQVTTGEECTYLIIQCASAVYDDFIQTLQIQEGSTVTPYEPYGKYKIPVVTRGINLINVDDFKNGNFKVNVDGSCTLSWTLSSRFSAYNTNLSHIPAGSKLVFKTSIVDATTNYKHVLIQLTYSNGTTKYLTCNGSTRITLEDTIKRVGLYVHNSEEKGSYITFKEFGLYYENEYIGYESYTEPTSTNIFLNEPLRKIGNYADYVDFKNKKVVRYNYGFTITSSISDDWRFGVDTWQRDGHVDVNIQKFFKYQPIQGKGVCNRFESGNWTWESNTFPNSYIYFWDSRVHIIIENKYLDGITDESTNAQKISAVKAFFDVNNTYVVYPMKTPTEESITCELPKLNAKTTIIEVDTSIAPSDAYGKYIKR